MSERIARMDSDDLLQNADEVIAAAQGMLRALCHGERWRMSVPVQDGDSDVPIGAVIRLAARLRDELYTTRAALLEAPDPGMALIESVITWRDYASHLQWCRTCAEDSEGSCFDGTALKEAAEAADKRCDELAIAALRADKGNERSGLPHSSKETE